MAPWAGRVEGARLEWERKVHALSANLGPHSIHGVVFDEEWSIGDATDDRVTVSCEFDQSRWPLGGGVRQTFAMRPGMVEITGAVKAGARSMPAALGWHPWFRRPPTADMRVRIDAARVLQTTPELIPTGRTEPVEGTTDLRAGPLLGNRRLDHVYVGARSPASIDWPDLSMQLEFHAPVATLVVYTPESGVCVEPQTAWPNPFALSASGVRGTGLVALAPGETLLAGALMRWRAR